MIGGKIMNELELKIKEMIIERYGSIKKFSEVIDMPWTTLDSILKRGFANSNITNVLKITKELKIEAEQLVDGLIEEYSIDNAFFEKSNVSEAIKAQNSRLGTYSYYLNDEARDLAQFLYENPDYKVLFDASRNVKKDDIEFVKQMLDRFKEQER